MENTAQRKILIVCKIYQKQMYQLTHGRVNEVCPLELFKWFSPPYNGRRWSPFLLEREKETEREGVLFDGTLPETTSRNIDTPETTDKHPPSNPQRKYLVLFNVLQFGSNNLSVKIPLAWSFIRSKMQFCITDQIFGCFFRR